MPAIIRNSLFRYAVVAAVGFAPGQLTAQEISIGPYAGSTNNPEVPRLLGLTASVAVFPVQFLGARFSYGPVWSHKSEVGVTCYDYWRGTGCRYEVLNSHGRGSLASFGVMARSPTLAGWRVEMEKGSSRFNVLRLRVEGADTGRSYEAEVPTGGANDLASLLKGNGGLIRLGLTRENLLARGISAGLHYEQRSADLHACVLDAFAPFCEMVRFRGLQLSVTLKGDQS